MIRCLLPIILLLSPLSAAENGVTHDTITLGMSSALSGPSEQLGQHIKQGSQLYFDEVNRKGGVFGRKIQVISLDDGYEPIRTVENTRLLLLQKDIFALFGYVGTPTSHAILPLLESSKVPYLMPFTGAAFLRTPTRPTIYNLRASYQQEAVAQIHYLINSRKYTKIGLLIQADEFGLALEEALHTALAEHKLTPVITTRFRRNTSDIKAALLALEQHDLEAVSLVGTYKPLSELINLGFEHQFKPTFATVSFASSKELFKHIKYPSDIIVSEVVPNPSTCQLEICFEFRALAKAQGMTEYNQVSFEGFINAKVFIETASSCGRQLNQTCLLNKLTSLSGDFYGLEINSDKSDHQGLKHVYMSFSH